MRPWLAALLVVVHYSSTLDIESSATTTKSAFLKRVLKQSSHTSTSTSSERTNIVGVMQVENTLACVGMQGLYERARHNAKR